MGALFWTEMHCPPAPMYYCHMAYRWGGRSRFFEPERQLSVLDLVNFGTLDLRVAGLLWLLMDHRASMLACAGPNFAGKTTMLNVLLGFLRPEVKQVRMQGEYEEFAFLKDSVPANTYLVAEEFSDYNNYEYVWGDAGRKAFELLTQGYGLGGTLHARSAREAVYILHDYLEVPIEHLARLDALVVIRPVAGRVYGNVLRRVESVSLLGQSEQGLSLEVIAGRDKTGEKLIIGEDAQLQTALSARLKLGKTPVAAQIDERAKFLGKLLTERHTSAVEVRKAVVDWYEGKK